MTAKRPALQALLAAASSGVRGAKIRETAGAGAGVGVGGGEADDDDDDDEDPQELLLSLLSDGALDGDTCRWAARLLMVLEMQDEEHWNTVRSFAVDVLTHARSLFERGKGACKVASHIRACLPLAV